MPLPWFRRKKPQTRAPVDGTEGDLSWEDTFPSPDAGPDALYARERVLQELVAALEELPEGQRATFIAHEFDGLSFQEIAEMTGETQKVTS